NAYYTSNTINFYTAGGGCNMTAFQTVIVHEWGHGLDAVFGGISQTDGLSEGWGDLLGLYRSGQPELGAGFRTGTTNGIRTGNNTLTYPAGGGVHQQGQTWMGWAWDLRKNLIVTHGSTAGPAIAEKIVIPSIAADATNQPNAVREVFIVDDDDGNLNNGTPNYLDLEKAALKRKLPYPKRTNPNAATFTIFGNGCQGTGKGPSFCVSNNSTGGTLTNTTAANEYAYQVINSTARTVTGFEVYSDATGSSPVTVQTAIYADTGSGMPSTSPLASGTITIGTTPGFYRSNISVSVPAGNFYVSVDHSAATTYLANVSSGASGIAFWRRPPMGSGAFARSGLVSRSSFRVLCAGGGGNAVPLLSNDGLPEIGHSFDVTIEQGRANAPATLLNGISNTVWGGGALPFSLAPLGASGCDLLVSPDYALGIALDSQGKGQVTFPVPNVPAYFGLKVHHQYYVLDPSVNTLGIAVTRGGTSKVGQR
ncbi:MAG: M36 family metallopeptidase, partial [Planctomycetota bacterium]|nr:M36 family metallopeptidase [Planctomycetota bacterium]